MFRWDLRAKAYCVTAPLQERPGGTLSCGTASPAHHTDDVKPGAKATPEGISPTASSLAHALGRMLNAYSFIYYMCADSLHNPDLAFTVK